MARGTTRSTQRIFAASLLTGLVAVLTGCIGGRVIVDASDGSILKRASALHVSFAEDERNQEQVLSPSVAADLIARVESTLRQKGYTIAGPDDSDLILELAARTAPVTMRTWTSDTDASGEKLVERTEAALGLRARERADGHEVWHAEARGRLPEPKLTFTNSVDNVWNRLLTETLERIPTR